MSSWSVSPLKLTPSERVKTGKIRFLLLKFSKYLPCSCCAGILSSSWWKIGFDLHWTHMQHWLQSIPRKCSIKYLKCPFSALRPFHNSQSLFHLKVKHYCFDSNCCLQMKLYPRCCCVIRQANLLVDLTERRCKIVGWLEEQNPNKTDQNILLILEILMGLLKCCLRDDTNFAQTAIERRLCNETSIIQHTWQMTMRVMRNRQFNFKSKLCFENKTKKWLKPLCHLWSVHRETDCCWDNRKDEEFCEKNFLWIYCLSHHPGRRIIS